MRNVILGALVGGLLGLPALAPSDLGAQAGGTLARWSAPCFPEVECGSVSATTADQLHSPIPANLPRRVGLWPHAISAFTALALASTLDHRIQTEVQSRRGENGDDLARLTRRMGQPEVYAPIALGTLAVGMVSGDGRIARAGGRITGGLLLSGLTVSLLKPLVGRARPGSSTDEYNFRPLSRQDSWPSGHTTMAFALATSVSDEVRFIPVAVVLYGGATLTAWSRVNDNRHWATDVVTGALVGIVSAKLMNGRWRVFGVTAPRFLLEGDRVGLGFEF